MYRIKRLENRLAVQEGQISDLTEQFHQDIETFQITIEDLKRALVRRCGVDFTGGQAAAQDEGDKHNRQKRSLEAQMQQLMAHIVRL